eukprot:COSAG06_NODE_70171_length_193_cov_73.925532_1_plen_23_part_10
MCGKTVFSISPAARETDERWEAI